MTFKKAEMAKTFRNGLSMSETDPLNHKWLDFASCLGLALHQFQKKTAVKSSYTPCSSEYGGQFPDYFSDFIVRYRYMSPFYLPCKI